MVVDAREVIHVLNNYNISVQQSRVNNKKYKDTMLVFGDNKWLLLFLSKPFDCLSIQYLIILTHSLICLNIIFNQSKHNIVFVHEK